MTSQLIHTPEPKIIKPFDEATFADLKAHITQLRRAFDWPGIPLHDKDANPQDKMNRWFWHNLPLLRFLHRSPEFVKLASGIFGQDVIPSYVFLSMYGPEGVVPLHTDRPQCQFTIDLQISSDDQWPIYVSEKPYLLEDGEALCYSGTGQPHFRKSMKEDSKATWMNLAFFHFVPNSWQGSLD